MKPTKPTKPKTPQIKVTRVIDGDTVELANGRSVRLLGIDTPEVGDCGYDQATRRMEGLVLNRMVTLVKATEDTDRYGRLLRYVDVANVDAGYRQIRTGEAIARYDSRDGYGAHPREHRYISADRTAPNANVCAAPKPRPRPKPASSPASVSYANCTASARRCSRWARFST